MMLSQTLMQVIADNREQIADAAGKRIQQDERTLNLSKLSDAGLQRWPSSILQGLASWSPAKTDDELVRQYQNLGRACFEQLIPLHEMLRGIQIVKRKAIDFTRGRGFGATSLEVYAQEELEHRFGLFFDWLIYQVALGYEQAQAERREPRYSRVAEKQRADHPFRQY